LFASFVVCFFFKHATTFKGKAKTVTATTEKEHALLFFNNFFFFDSFGINGH